MDASQGKAIIFSAPSGSGKTSIVQGLLSVIPSLRFSISACTREPRVKEVHGRDYYFLSPEEFRRRIDQGEFVEWEEVYEGLFYGTLKSELDRVWNSGSHVIFDVDVKGGLNIKKYLQGRALAIFVKVPSEDDLRERLTKRQTESEESMQKRIKKAKYEATFEPEFDQTLLNEDLGQAIDQAAIMVNEFLEGKPGKS